MRYAKGSLSSAINEHYPTMHQWPVCNISHNDSGPILNGLARHGVNVGHFTLLGKDEERMDRVALAIRSGGWSMNEAEVEAFHTFGEKRMQIADHVAHVWGSCEVAPKHKRIRYALLPDGNEWSMVCVRGVPLMAMYKKICQHPIISVPHMEKEVLPRMLEWDKEYVPPKAGYYLTRPMTYNDKMAWKDSSHGRNLKWEETLEVVKHLGPEYEIVHPGIMLEAYISHLFMVGYSDDTTDSFNEQYRFNHVHCAGKMTANGVPVNLAGPGGLIGVYRGEDEHGNTKRPNMRYLLVHHYPFKGWTGNVVICQKYDW